MTSNIQYITDESGQKTSVIISLSDYQKIIDDVHDLAAVAERRAEPSIPHEQFVEELKRDGIL